MTKYKKYAMLSLTVAVFGEIYFHPFQSDLRFSSGIIVLNLILLIADDISELKLTLVCSATVFLIRCMLNFILVPDFQQALMLNFPSAVYYLAYGCLLRLMNLKDKKDSLFSAVFILTFSDSLSNIIEAVIRNNVTYDIVRVIILAGFLRSIIGYLIYLFYNRQKLFILGKEHKKRYSQLNLLVASIQSELFYLRKSMNDIEKVMSESYSLYEECRHDKALKEKTLGIAREVHEIKKDYYRVLKGFEAFMSSIESYDGMKLSIMLSIIKDNTERFLSSTDKELKLIFSYDRDYEFKAYYSLFTLFNNLIINSIEASSDGGTIRITVKDADSCICFDITDEGKGIEEDIMPYIFNPGFTTKYDENSGKASTGIGLANVKNIVEDLHGTIRVESALHKGASFILHIPKASLI